MSKRNTKSERMALSLPSSMKRKIASLAKEQGKPQSQVVLETLRFLGVKPGELMRDPNPLMGRRLPPPDASALTGVRSVRSPLPGLEDSTVPGRVTINLSGEMAARVNDLAARSGVSKNSIVLTALEQSLAARSPAAVLVANRGDIVRYSRIVIAALQEAVDYDSARQHNQPPPDLRLDDPAYLNELKALIAELKRLNDLLEKPKPPVKITEKAVRALSKHFDTFLGSYAKSLGVGIAGLTVGTMAALLYKAGVSKDVIDTIWQHVPK